MTAAGSDRGPPPVGTRTDAVVLPDTHGTPVTVGGSHGSPTLLVLLPFAFSGTCTREVQELAGVTDDLAGRGVRVLAATCDAVFTLRAWSEQLDLPFGLLSDFWPHGGVARAFGAFDERSGTARRVTVLMDAAGVVRWTVATGPGEARDATAYRAAAALLDPAG